MWNRLRASIGQPNFYESDDEPFWPYDGDDVEVAEETVSV